ncbi:M20/M25/M40 family metallo-hydrolase [Streptomyces sp. B1866]|uniref:M20/M25/M40 family metallo-hydrolase n=1 Tax=Streptomyces sp. B1866 TaxID=3075431 RepID=UPI0028908E5D|nr:M20/M25/M40 family metallo-hydrolase [Streptomyces sp. B1866]MDT3399026.1 M20/M25/M40 family metallo-hydrolase [Streptomyces sp. B1866]
MNANTDLAGKVNELGDGLVADLMKLVEIPSVYDPSNIKPVQDAAKKCVGLLKGTGITDVEQKHIGDAQKNAPLVYATCGPSKGPTVLLYAHYDVVPAGDWANAFKPEKKKMPDGRTRVFGRGAADDKSGVMMHVGALRAFDGKPPVNLKIVIEGEEESGGTLEEYVRKNPDLFKADVLVIADTGNHKLGEPTFTTSLRGVVAADVTVSTLQSPVHSGVFGGPPPDAFMTLVRMLAQLHDDAGDVAIPDLVRQHWQGREPDEQEFRTQAGVKPGVRLIGTDTLGSRLYTRPSVNVVGLDGPPPTGKSINRLQPTATARVSVRIAPLETPQDAIARLQQFLEGPALNPWNACVTVQPVPGAVGAGFQADTTRPGYAVAKKAMEHAYPGKQTVFTGVGGAIPLVTELQKVNQDATLLLLGCEEPLCRIHSAPESVDVGELEAMTLAECYLLYFLAHPESAETETLAPTAVPVSP